MTPFRATRRVEFHETDLAGIVHFSNFFRYMEYAEVEFLRSRGLSVKLALDGVEYGFPRVSATCNYLKPAKFDEVLAIDVVVERVGGKSMTYAFEFSRDGEVLANGKTTSVCCRIDAGHKLCSVEIPPAFRQRVQAGEA